MVYSQICHKYIHIMGWKDQTSKEIATCEKLDSLTSCCEQAAAGMVRAFPAHFVPLQSNSTHCNMHGSRAATENCMTYGISCETHCWRNHWEFTHFKQAILKSVYFALKSCTFYRAREPHVNLDPYTFHTVSQQKWSKFHLKIPAREWQHGLQ